MYACVNKKIYLTIIFFITSCFHTYAAVRESSAPARQFTVTDSIEMTRLLDPVVTTSSHYFSSDFKFSADRQHLAIVIRRGNLETGLNDYEIRLYTTADIRSHIQNSSENGVPPFTELLTLSSASSDQGLTLEGIRELRWLPDNNTIAFIGHDGDRPGQVYSIDIRTKILEQLTHHPSTVYSYDFNGTSEHIVYSARIDRPDEALRKTSFVVGNKSINDIMNLGGAGSAPFDFQFYLTQKKSQVPPVVLGQDVFFTLMAGSVALSPKGKWAVVGRRVTEIDKLSQWMAAYIPFTTMPHIRNSLLDVDTNIVKPPVLIKQLMLINLRDGSIKPFFDAPDGEGMGGALVQSHWLPDGENVILVNTFLPLEPTLDPRERKRRRKVPAIIEYNVETGIYRRLTDLQPLGPDYQAPEMISGSSLSADGVLSVSWKTPGNKVIVREYYKEKGSWRERTPSSDVTEESQYDFTLSVKQNKDTAPDIWVRDHQSGDERRVTALNPQFKALTFGKHEVLTWRDKAGRHWRAGLISPPHFKKGRRYPLVIQTHGYNEREFLIDGPGGATSVFAAQALANKGMLVVQLGEQRQGFGSRQELLNEQAGIESVIDLLDERKILDRNRVGVAGWSSTGVTLLHTITFSDYEIAAATLSDSFGLGLFDYILRFGGTAGAAFGQAEGKMGAVPWGKEVSTWISRDPAFHTDRITTPLRLEQYADYRWILGFWDIYALLKRQKKPVEFLFFPNGTHNLTKPRERYDSQQGNVDWFSFWLKGEVDPDPAKAEQYKRWQELKVQHRDKNK